MGNRVAIERRPVSLTAILTAAQPSTDSDNFFSSSSSSSLPTLSPPAWSTSEGGEFGSVLHIWRFFDQPQDDDSKIQANQLNKVDGNKSRDGEEEEEAEDEEREGGGGGGQGQQGGEDDDEAKEAPVVREAAVNLATAPTAFFDRRQVYLTLHIFAANAGDEGDDGPNKSNLDAGGRFSAAAAGGVATEAAALAGQPQPSLQAVGPVELESLLTSSVEAFTPRGLASCLEEALLTSTLTDGGASVCSPAAAPTASSSSASSSSAVTATASLARDSEPGGAVGAGEAPNREGRNGEEQSTTGGGLAYHMYVWRGKDSSRYTQALALTRGFELAQALKNNDKRLLWQLYRGGDKVALSSRFTESLSNQLADARPLGGPSAPSFLGSCTENSANGEALDDAHSRELHHHLYHQLVKKRRITPTAISRSTHSSSSSSSSEGEGEEDTSSEQNHIGESEEGRSNGSVPKLSLLRIRGLNLPLASSSVQRSMSADSASEIALSSPYEDLPTSHFSSLHSKASSSPRTDGNQSSSMSMDLALEGDPSSTSTSTSSSTSTSTSTSSSSSSSSGTPRSKSSSSATIPSPSTPPLSHKQIKSKFKLPPFKTDSACKSGPTPTIPAIGGLKLADLQSLQLVSEEPDTSDPFKESEVKLRGDKLKKYDGVCSKITDHLYLGSQTVSKDLDMLKQHGITHILNCAGSICPEYYPNEFTYRTLYLMDGVREDITCMLYDIIEWMENVISSNGKILVHCQQGVSRSSAMMIGYLMWKHGWDFERTHMFVKDRRGVSNPNPGFICQLLYLAKRLAVARSGNHQETRLYQIVVHSRHDPDFIVAKLAKKQDINQLLEQEVEGSSSSCYILQSPDEFYIWIGSHCSQRLVDVAERTVRRIQSFENATSIVKTIEQGREPDEFKQRLQSIVSWN